jgi:integrase
MAAKVLTAKAVEAEKPRAHRIEIPDAGCKGLYLVVQPKPSQSKSWAVRFRDSNGRSTKLTLGRAGEVVGALTLGAARKAAAEALHQLERGQDPAAQKRMARTTAVLADAERQRDSVEAQADAFIERYAKIKQRSWHQTARLFAKEIVPAWRGRSVHDIKKRDVVELLEDIASDRPILANRVQAAVRRFYRWLVDREVVAVNPALKIESQGTEKERERVLTDDEIRRLWIAAGELPPPNDAFIKLLLLTGQRRCEVSGMRLDELFLDLNQALWTLPGARTKNKETHIVPLSKQAAQIIKETKRIHGSAFVLTTNGDAPVSAFNKTKRRLDELMHTDKPWVLHDMRRTCTTGLQRLGVRLEVTEKILNHRSGKIKGPAKVYHRHDFAVEKRQALQAWADHVEALVSGNVPADNVEDLATARRAKRVAKELA